MRGGDKERSKYTIGLTDGRAGRLDAFMAIAAP
jgi:hypothetical protein